jgi:hypothetical protein
MGQVPAELRARAVRLVAESNGSSSVYVGIGAAGVAHPRLAHRPDLAAPVAVDGIMTSGSDPTWTTPPEPPLLRAWSR